jgi:hypothetical protein
MVPALEKNCLSELVLEDGNSEGGCSASGRRSTSRHRNLYACSPHYGKQVIHKPLRMDLQNRVIAD